MPESLPFPHEPLRCPRRRIAASSTRTAGAVFVIVAFTALLAGCDGRASQPGAVRAPPPVSVRVLVAQPRSVPIVLEATARTEGSREVEVRARVTGILERQMFREGEEIRAGAPMYRIDRAPFEIALAQAQAALAQERARAERARIEASRLKVLVEDRAISRREYDDAVSEQLQSNAAVQAAQARVREAELNLSYTTVNAPISGIAGRAMRSEGSLVVANGDSSLLATITRTDPIWVRFALSEPEYAQLRDSGERAAKVTVSLPDGSDYARSGKLNFTGSTIDEKLGTVQLRAELSNPSLELLPGQFVRARVAIGARDAFVVPQSAVQQTQLGRFVWVVDAADQVSQRIVQTGGWQGDDWIVREGLQPGDRVAIDNVMRLGPGMKVAPTPMGGPASAEAAAPAVSESPAAVAGSGSPSAAAAAPTESAAGSAPGSTARSAPKSASASVPMSTRAGDSRSSK